LPLVEHSPARQRIAAIHPTLDRPYAALDVSARLPGGERVTLLRLSRAPARVAAALLGSPTR